MKDMKPPAKEKSKQTMMENAKRDKDAMEKVMAKIHQPKCKVPEDM